MYVVGEAAIALAFDERRATRDIDAVFEPKATVYEVAAEMAAEHDLPDGWLNDAAKGFLAAADADAAQVLEVPGLRVSSASPRILLAMKVLSHRIGEDDRTVTDPPWTMTSSFPRIPSSGRHGVVGRRGEDGRDRAAVALSDGNRAVTQRVGADRTAPRAPGERRGAAPASCRTGRLTRATPAAPPVPRGRRRAADGPAGPRRRRARAA